MVCGMKNHLIYQPMFCVSALLILTHSTSADAVCAPPNNMQMAAKTDSKSDSKSASAPTTKVGETRRALHWVFRVGDLQKSVEFYQSVFGMLVCRHEEFEKECDASCNGPYAGHWSKTMIGPNGDEHKQFVLELTYNYGIDSYKLGNDYRHIAIRDTTDANATGPANTNGYGADGSAMTYPQRAKAKGFIVEHSQSEGGQLITAPDGYKYLVIDETENPTPNAPKIAYVSLHTGAGLKAVKSYWCDVLGMVVVRESADRVLVSYDWPKQTGLEFVVLPTGQKLDHAEAFGRVAFDIAEPVTVIEAAVKKSGDPIQVGPLTLDTPGKATVTVIITRDRDGTEICHVDRIGFKSLSTANPGDDQIDWKVRTTSGEAVWCALVY